MASTPSGPDIPLSPPQKDEVTCAIPEKPVDLKTHTLKRNPCLDVPLGLYGVIPAGKSSCYLDGKRKHKGGG
jgi:hypothetical protein